MFTKLNIALRLRSVQSSVRLHVEQDMSTGVAQWSVVPVTAHTSTQFLPDVQGAQSDLGASGVPRMKTDSLSDEEGSVGSTEW